MPSIAPVPVAPEEMEHAPPVPLENPNAIMHPIVTRDDWKGVPLKNVGNTCYLTAAANGLLSIQCIRNGLGTLEDNQQNVIPRGKILNE